MTAILPKFFELWNDDWVPHHFRVKLFNDTDTDGNKQLSVLELQALIAYWKSEGLMNDLAQWWW